jgi:phosphoserine phosphatase
LNETPLENVLTLIAPPGILDDAIVAAATAALKGLGLEPAPPDWLSPGEACDIAFEMTEPKAAEDAIRDALKDATVDLCCGPVSGRRKKILVADMDSTIITSETIDELAALAGKGAEISAITERSMKGEIDFPDALRERLAMLKGLPETAIEETLKGVALTPGAETLVRTMTAHGAYAALVSGGFRHFGDPVAAMAGFDEVTANRFDIEDGRLTGRAAGPIVGPEAKLGTLTRLSGERGIPVLETLAIGDGANDVPMIRAAGLGIAFHAKPVAREAANASIDHTGLTAALFMQGYRLGEFAVK